MVSLLSKLNENSTLSISCSTQRHFNSLAVLNISQMVVGQLAYTSCQIFVSVAYFMLKHPPTLTTTTFLPLEGLFFTPKEKI